MDKSSFGALFKEAYRIYQKNIAKIIALAAMICLPIQILKWFADARLNNLEELTELFVQRSSGAITDESLFNALVQDGVGKFYIYFLVSEVILVLGMVFTIAVIKITMDNARFGLIGSGAAQTVVYEQKNDELLSTGDYFSFAARKLPKYAWTAVIGLVFTVGGMLLCIFPGIIARMVSLLTVYTVTITTLWGRKAFRYTIAVLRCRPGILLLFVALFFVQQLLLSAAVSIPVLFSFPAQAECVFYVVIISVLQVIFALFDVFLTLVFADTIRAVPPLAEIAAKAEKPDQNGL